MVEEDIVTQHEVFSKNKCYIFVDHIYIRTLSFHRASCHAYIHPSLAPHQPVEESPLLLPISPSKPFFPTSSDFLDSS